ncbi:MAG TPA: 50S ribosomal protein L6 [Dehalococcoidia bacterium]|jgi:large subunit ribosomal protein L6|nr:50S ribosomal protein L6 [Dehalococcoidia bacterium]
MSRIGLLPIAIPQGTEVKIDGSEVVVKGSKGELRRRFHPGISVALKNGDLIVTRPSDSKIYRSLHGLTRSLLANMVTGVSEGFEKVLEINGVGYRAQQSGNKLLLQVGYSNTVEFSPPPGISISIEGTNRIRVAGIDKEAVGEAAARIRAVRPPDSYKGKGIKYSGEKLRLKPGKAGKIGKK